METQIIIMASIDYDIDVEIVERIYRKYPDTFYEELERYILERSEK